MSEETHYQMSHGRVQIDGEYYGNASRKSLQRGDDSKITWVLGFDSITPELLRRVYNGPKSCAISFVQNNPVGRNLLFDGFGTIEYVDTDLAPSEGFTTATVEIAMTTAVAISWVDEPGST